MCGERTVKQLVLNAARLNLVSQQFLYPLLCLRAGAVDDEQHRHIQSLPESSTPELSYYTVTTTLSESSTPELSYSTTQ